jgi:hypothetical protein
MNAHLSGVGGASPSSCLEYQTRTSPACGGLHFVAQLSGVGGASPSSSLENQTRTSPACGGLHFVAQLLARAGLIALAATAFACEKSSPTPSPAPSSSPTTASAPVPAPKLDRVARADFNRVAAELALPLFWTEDHNRNSALDPEELAVYWGLEKGASLKEYVSGGAFTPKLLETYEKIAKQKTDGAKDDDPRRAAVKKELGQGRVTLVATDLTKASPEEKRFVTSIVRASEMIESLYAKQQGTTDLAAKVPPGDPASKTLFFRGQGPKCEAPMTANDPTCGALAAADMPKGKISGLYPPDLLRKPKFCDEIGKKDKKLVDPFTAVTSKASLDEAIKAAADTSDTVSPARLAQLEAKPYHEAWATDVQAIAKELEAARAALGDREPALKEYLAAAAKSFTSDDWWSADEAWAKMDAKNSKYYLRIAPDEVYDEPCSTKALYHVSFGLINQGSVKWQEKLDPLKTEMEVALATLAGPPYAARDVKFKIPDFVDVTINAGDSRKAFGATIGQSLPNFGPVANGGRGRTVAMTNFYGDPDSVATSKEQAESLFCKETMAKWTDSSEPQLMSTVLHEASHNLGPAHQYKANGKIDREAFGGPLASTLEELKAQTAALYFTEWLIEKKQVTRDDADKAHVRDIFWAFGHISRGMYTAEKHPNNYSQLAAIQVGALMKDGALTFKTDERATNGKDAGCFALDLAKMPNAIKTLMTEVAKIKGKGDKAAGDALIKTYVDVTGEKKKVHDLITERITRAPKASFVYAVKLD